MSNFIEDTARGIKGSLTGVVSDKQLDQAQTARGDKLIKQLATGGLALGAGASTVVALMNYLKSIKQESDLDDPSRLNDDTLYVRGMKKDEAEKSAAEDGLGVNKWLAPGVALTGGVLSAGGAYALTQALYNYMQKKRLQDKLDDAQGEALLAADMDMGKEASDAKVQPKLFDLLLGAPVALPILAALASGGISYAALNKAFPTVQKPKRKYPKKIREVADDGEISKVEHTMREKSASANLYMDSDLEDAANEFLIMMTDTLSQEKKATHSITSDILSRAAKDGVKGMEETYKSAGLEGLSASVQGAYDSSLTETDKVIGAALISKSARLSPIVAGVAAAEYQDLVPGISASVAEQEDPDYIDKMAGVGALLHLNLMRPKMLNKSASSMALQQLAEVLGEATPEDLEEELTSDAGGNMTEDAEGDVEELIDGEGDITPEAGREDDPIDEAILGDISGALGEDLV